MDLFVAVFLVSGVGAATLRGTVTDITSAAIQNAYVFVFDNQAKVSPGAPLPGKGALTKYSGTFQVKLAPGFYDVCVFSAGFTAACQKIQIAAGTLSVNHDVKLEVNLLMLEERGDRFLAH